MESPDTATLAVASSPSPLGEISFALHGEALCALGFEHPRSGLASLLERRFGGPIDRSGAGRGVAKIRDALARYFSGELRALESLALDAAGTPFQRAVWSALREIPAGETRSYLEIAVRLGNPKAVRAVGMANARNPIGIVVPCHRVIGADGTLTGYASGLPRKRWLLVHEGALEASSAQEASQLAFA